MYSLIDIANIHEYTTDRPRTWTIFGSPEEFDKLPKIHQEQIHFLDKKASTFLYDFLENAKLISGKLWDPFSKGNFNSIEKFINFSNSDKSKSELKKWLYKKPIPFRNSVFILPNYDNFPILTTWKIVIKYGHDIFHVDDIIIFDKSLNWCLFYYHENELFFGKDNVYDSNDEDKKIELLNEKKKKYPHFKHPYL